MGGENMWLGSTVPWAGDAIGAIVSGVESEVVPAKDTDLGLQSTHMLSKDDGTGGDAIRDRKNRMLTGVMTGVPTLGDKYTNAGRDQKVLDFGVLREAVLGVTRSKSTAYDNADGPNFEGTHHGTVPYWNGPFINAARLTEPLWQLTNRLNVQMLTPQSGNNGAYTAPALPIGAAVKAVTKPDVTTNLGLLKTNVDSWIGSDVETLDGALGTPLIEDDDDDTTYAKLFGLLTEITPEDIDDWTPVGYTVPSAAPITTVFPVASGTVAAGTVSSGGGNIGTIGHTTIVKGDVEYEGNTVSIGADEVTATEVTAGAVSATSVTADAVAADSVSAPTGLEADEVEVTVSPITVALLDVESGSVTAPEITAIGAIEAPTITEPDAVSVQNNVDDAIDAFAVEADLRYAQEEAALRATLFGSRAIMTSAFDNALAILAANKQAQVNEYSKSLRVKQTELEVQSALSHQTNLLEQRGRNAALLLEAGKANAANDLEVARENARLALEANQATVTLALDAAKANASIALDHLRAESDFNLRVADITLDAAKATAGLALDAAKVTAELTLDAAKADAGLALDAAKTAASLALDADRVTAELALDAAKTAAGLNLDAAKTTAELLLDAEKVTASLALDAAKAEASLQIQDHGLVIDAGKATLAASVDVERANAELTLDAQKALAGFSIQQAGLVLEGLRAKEQMAMEASRATQQIAMEARRAEHELQLKSVELALRADETNLRIATAVADLSLRAKTASAEIGAGLIRAVYDTTISWMQARSSSMSNAGVIASIIGNANELTMRGEDSDRNAYMNFLGYSTDTARSISAGYEGIAQLRWKSMLQNTMVLKESVSAFQGIGGVEHHPSGFEKASQVAGLGMGLVSAGINLGMVLG